MRLSDQLQQDHASGDFGRALDGYSRRARKLEIALERIERWFGEFPEATLHDGTKCSYGAAYGSNGERDFMRKIAKDALNS